MEKLLNEPEPLKVLAEDWMTMLCPHTVQHPMNARDCVRCVVWLLERVVTSRDDLLLRLSRWDHMNTAGDGPFWRREIARVLGLSPESAPERKP